jgi:hypothetical protein
VKAVLEGKLSDILVSSSLVSQSDAWPKQLLSVVAQTDEHAAAVAEAYTMIDDAIRADTIVFVTSTHGDDGFVYYNQ